MDQRLQYEQLIAGKLESLPIPDMQDAIWSRIKSQLDIDMPTDDGGGDAGPQSPPGPGIIGWGLSVLLLAVLTVFFLSKNKTVPAENENAVTPTEQIITPNEQGAGPPALINPGNETPQFPRGSGIPAGVVNLPADSAPPQELSGIISPAADSIKVIPSQTAAIPPQAVDTTVKKGRGVPVNPSDYRIVPKKDSQ